MTVTFYAAVQDANGVFGPVIPFEHHDDGSYDNEGNWTPNPDFIHDASLTLSNGNAYFVLESLGLDSHDTLFPTELLIERCRACLDYTYSRSLCATEGSNERYLAEKIPALQRLALLGRIMGAPYVCAS